jgi:glycosyltransferase involved in cell wall biosynthesis
MMPLEQPAVSVVTATRNRPALVAEALRSIAGQSFGDFEAIVIDDGSDAATLAAYEPLLQELGSRFRVLRASGPDAPGTGPAAARNRGIRAARAELVAFLDDDDLWTARDHLEAGVTAIRQYQADYYFANMQGVRGERIVIPDWYKGDSRITAGRTLQEKPPIVELDRRGLRALMQHYEVHPNQAVVRRSLLLKTGGFWERIRFSEDYELMMRLLDGAQRVLYRPDLCVRYRLPAGDSVSLVDNKKDHLVQLLACTQHIRATSERGEVRRCARAKEGWTLRQLADHLSAEGRDAAALSMAWQGLCVFPTFGGCAALAKHLGRAAMRAARLRSRPMIQETVRR